MGITLAKSINLEVVEIIVIFYSFPTKTKISLVSLPTSNSSNPLLTFQHRLSGVTTCQVCPADVGSAQVCPCFGEEAPLVQTTSMWDGPF